VADAEPAFRKALDKVPLQPGRVPVYANTTAEPYPDDEAEARDPLHLRTWVVLVDGAEHQLGLIRAEAARRAVTIRIVIDIIHVLEYLWSAAWSCHPAGDPAAEDWVAARALAVLAGDSDRAAAEITAEAGAAGLDSSRRSGADACVRSGSCCGWAWALNRGASWSDWSRHTRVWSRRSSQVPAPVTQRQSLLRGSTGPGKCRKLRLAYRAHRPPP